MPTTRVFLGGSGRGLGGAKGAAVLAAALLAALAVLMAVAPGVGPAAAPPTGDAGIAISTAPAGTVAGSVDAGDAHNCGVKTDGTIACWGSNGSGQTSAPSGTFSAVSTGFSHSCGVKTDGMLACWGSNGFGQLAAAPASPSLAPPAAGQVGSAYSHTFTSSTGSPSGSFSVSAGALPPGLSLSDAGILSGTPTAGGEYTFTVTASNGFFADSSQEFTISIASDTSAPTTKIDLSPAAPDGSNGWYVSIVRATVSAEDEAGGTGVAETRCVLDPDTAPTSFDDLPSGCDYTGLAGKDVGDDGEHTLYAASKDEVGNEEALRSTTFKIDATAPTVSCVDPAGPTFVLDGTGGNVAATVTDGTSGPVSASLSAAANVSSVGNKSVSLTGSDNAGNSTTQSCSYRVKYNFLGFLSPIPQSTFKASSTIPVKFMLANDAGTKISDAAAQDLVASPCKVKVFFSGGTPANNCATYNATTDTFQFVLKTSKSLSSGTYTISVEVSAPDGSGLVNKETVQVTIRL